MRSLGTCMLCGCTEDRPCLGGTVFLSAWEAVVTHRLVADEKLLPAGEHCHWVDELETVCSAHSDDELVPLFSPDRHREGLEAAP